MNGTIESALFGRVGQSSRVAYKRGWKTVARLTVTVGQGEDAEWLAVAVFCEVAQQLSGTLQKGDRVYVEGSLKVERWVKDGQERTRLSVAAWRADKIGCHWPQQEAPSGAGISRQECRA